MSLNFDSSQVGVPYSRVMCIGIKYPAPMTAAVEVITQMHVKLLDDSHVALGSSETLTFAITPGDFASGTVDLRNPSTGALLGASMSLGALFTGVASLIREKQIAVIPPAEIVEPVEPPTSPEIGEGV